MAELRAAGVAVSGVEDLGDHHADPRMRAVWQTFELPSGVTAEVLHEPVVWDGERLALHRSPLWMEHTYEVLVGELGLDLDRFAELIDSHVLW